ncbi:MAG: hypothetical protein A2542_03620 [Parcubacteria group bacterium RIFOXYD2_FULL_52_8]|nr:MAG: hypothetical protein A2542_03620 [Parcubacteria group bacterium RIFOXYD2_FULL_52_8]
MKNEVQRAIKILEQSKVACTADDPEVKKALVAVDKYLGSPKGKQAVQMLRLGNLEIFLTEKKDCIFGAGGFCRKVKAGWEALSHLDAILIAAQNDLHPTNFLRWLKGQISLVAKEVIQKDR